jgi:hypothetical protein
MVDWFTVVPNRDDNSGLALLSASELSLPGLDFIEPIFNLIPALFAEADKLRADLDAIDQASEDDEPSEEAERCWIEVDRHWSKGLVLFQGLPIIILKADFRPGPSLTL